MSDSSTHETRYSVVILNAISNKISQDSIIEYVRRFSFDQQIKGISTRRGYAIIPQIPNADGIYPSKGVDEDGREFDADVKYKDSQSDNVYISYQSNSQDEVIDRSPAETVCDRSATVADRIEALREWIGCDPNAVADFLVEELEKDGHELLWIETIILSSEHVRFEDLDARRRVGRSLLALAEKIRGERRIAESTIWCAIHRGGSLIPIEDLSLLDPFLGNRGGVDTRLAALQAIVRIFEAETEVGSSDLVSRLADRIKTLVIKYLDEDVFRPGEIAAIALEGSIALALISPERFVAISEILKSSTKLWFRRQLRKRLETLPERRRSRTQSLIEMIGSR